MGYEGPCCRACDGCLPVLGQSSTSTQPGKGAFNHPSARQNLEAFGVVTAFDDLDGPASFTSQCLLQLVPGIAAIGKDVTQEGIETADRLQRWHGSIPVLNGGAVNDQSNHETIGVGDDMALASLNLLAGIIAANTTALGGFDALTIDDTVTRTGFLARQSTRYLHESEVHQCQHSIVAPLVEIAAHR